MVFSEGEKNVIPSYAYECAVTATAETMLQGFTNRCCDCLGITMISVWSCSLFCPSDAMLGSHFR